MISKESFRTTLEELDKKYEAALAQQWGSGSQNSPTLQQLREIRRERDTVAARLAGVEESYLSDWILELNEKRAADFAIELYASEMKNLTTLEAARAQEVAESGKNSRPIGSRKMELNSLRTLVWLHTIVFEEEEKNLYELRLKKANLELEILQLRLKNARKLKRFLAKKKRRKFLKRMIALKEEEIAQLFVESQHTAA